MKSLIYWMLLIPFAVFSQETEEYMIMENVRLTANPEKIIEFEKALAEHNQKFHAEGTYGARVYTISSGNQAGKYVWAMGPLPWKALDNRPGKESGHDEHWKTKVLPYTLTDTDLNYWKFEQDLSNFSKGFKLNKLLIDVYDINRFKGEDTMKLMEKIRKVMTSKYQDNMYGVYTNEFSSTNDGDDLAFVMFFEKSAWLGEDPKFAKGYDEVHGEGSFKTFLKEWEASTSGSHTELWMFRSDLSGLGAEVNMPAAEAKK